MAVLPGRSGVAGGAPIFVQVRPSAAAYVYCYARDSAGTLQRIFPNRFTPDPRVDPAKPLNLPARGEFKLPAGGTVSCLAAPREVYNDLPAALRWGDFQALNAVRGVDEIQRLFEQVARTPVAQGSFSLPASR